MTMLLHSLLIGLLFALHATAMAQHNWFVNDAEPNAPDSVSDPEYWREQSITLPPWPREQDWLAVPLDNPGGSFDYWIDTRSLTTGADQVVRYILVAESASGARNLSFEGIRCSPAGHYQVYAYGQDGRFEPISTGGQWRAIERGGSDPARQELWRHYFCVPRQFAPRSRRDQLRLIKQGRVEGYEQTGFITE